VLFLFSLPFASAARSGFRVLDNAIEMMSRVFYPSILLRNQSVQIGFFKFLYFIMIFGMMNWALNKYVFGKGDDANGKRVSGTVAFSIAAIAAWFMPANVALGTAGLMTAIMSLLIPIGITIAGVYFCFKKFNEEWWQHLISIVILFTLIGILEWMLIFLG
jgi:hypothetical protein